MDTERLVSELVEADPDLADLVEAFVDGLTARLERMSTAVARSDFEDLHAAAHQLKGSAGGYGYPALTKAAARLEADALSRSLERCQTSLAELESLVRRVGVRR